MGREEPDAGDELVVVFGPLDLPVRGDLELSDADRELAVVTEPSDWEDLVLLRFFLISFGGSSSSSSCES